MENVSDIIWTYTDEAPAVASLSLFPIINSVLSQVGIKIETIDISLASRIISQFNDILQKEQYHQDGLSLLAQLIKKPTANIIKLPNISASQTQLLAAINEIRNIGYNIPFYPKEINNSQDQINFSIYESVKGSAVNPTLRQGNSNRTIAKIVKEHSQLTPVKLGDWSMKNKSHVASMKTGDFYINEHALTVKNSIKGLKIVLIAADGTKTVLRDNISVQAGDIIDASFMKVKKLIDYIDAEIADAKANNLLFSVHLKATMMKVSDPIIFGYFVKRFFKPLLDKYSSYFNDIGFNANDGIGVLFDMIEKLPQDMQDSILSDYENNLADMPSLAMVDSDLGITNLHQPNNVIIDASLPPIIVNSGCMWNKQGELQETKIMIPDRTYARVYNSFIDFLKQNGKLDPATMGSFSNIGLMACKAQEYGSHNYTFELPDSGHVRVVDSDHNVLLAHTVEAGDIWRMCITSDVAINNWIDLALKEALLKKEKLVFWLDESRKHDNELIAKVNQNLCDRDTGNVSVSILNPVKAVKVTLDHMRAGTNIIGATGNVLRDYLTDLFPILEVGTSAKMLSTIGLIKGGYVFETGAGGTAPKHVAQFTQEGHLRWNSLGEFLALMKSLEFLSNTKKQAGIMAATLEQAIVSLLHEDKLPARKAGGLDCRGSHAYLLYFWCAELAKQTQDSFIKNTFSKHLSFLEKNMELIESELTVSAKSNQDLGGYYVYDLLKADKCINSSECLNNFLKHTFIV